MKGKIVIPFKYKKRHNNDTRYSTREVVLFRGISKRYGMPIEYTDTPTFEDVDFALVFAVPYHNRPNIPLGLVKVDKKVKLIGFYGDLQCWNSSLCTKNKKIMFERYDIIIGAYKKMFEEWYPEFVYKHVFFPDYFAPHEAFAKLPINKEPIMKCLLSGNARKQWYPFRTSLKDQIPASLLECIKNIVPFRNYPWFINKYFCAIAVSGKIPCTIAKYFEIPAAGTLLLAERFEDVDDLGFKPGVHYLPLMKEDTEVQIETILRNPEEYKDIRHKGTKFVRTHHSINNRVNEFGKILEML